MTNLLRTLLVVLALLPTSVVSQPDAATDATETDFIIASITNPASKCYCLRPVHSQNDFKVLKTLGPGEDFEERRDYYADFGKEMVPEGSMVLYKGRMGLLNADCSVERLESMEFDFPMSHTPSERRVWMPLTIAGLAFSVLLMGQ